MINKKMISKENKKGQMKIQEMAFVLLAFAVLAAAVFIFVVRFQSVGIQDVAESLDQQRALSLRDRVATLPELKCARLSCIDKDKAEVIKRYNLDDLFQGLTSARVVTLYPAGERDIVLYDSGRESGKSYSTFVNLCEQIKTGPSFDYECALALLVVGV